MHCLSSSRIWQNSADLAEFGRSGRLRCGVLPVLITKQTNQDFLSRGWKIAIGSVKGGERN